MKYIADLHIHSKYSLATSKNLDLENLYIAAQLKGITVIGTGDFTHPGWFSEIKDKLVPAEPGLFKLKENIEKICDEQVPKSCRGIVRFILVSEISSIYKKNGRTRKNHNLVFMPDLEKAAQFNYKLDKIGNIKSDGRPILGLDARNLLEITIETAEQSFLVPAHIWTPWFSLLGSKSGFNSIKECFEDLSDYIFAVETGLSSDPAMNWRVSELDNITLISNSDAHSPLKLGREANILNTGLSFSEIRSAIQSGDKEKFLGTFEFFPEEGKYHYDGHRNCKIRFNPKESMNNNGICPVCSKPLTLGVLYRVEELADRPENIMPEKKHPYYSIIPLTDILSEIFMVGPTSKKVEEAYFKAINNIGCEFDILHKAEKEKLKKTDIPLLGEAIERMRNNKITLIPGYDGEFGTIKIFTPEDRNKLAGQKTIFSIPEKKAIINKYKENNISKSRKEKEYNFINKDVRIKKINIFNKQQKNIINNDFKSLLIMAGPGTGKTFTITQKIGQLIKEKNITPKQILAVTFTNKAAQEMSRRLSSLLKIKSLPFVGTFHSFCFNILKSLEKYSDSPTIISDYEREALIKDAIQNVYEKGTKLNKSKIVEYIISAKQNLLQPEEVYKICDSDQVSEITTIYKKYQQLLFNHNFLDYEDLIFNVIKFFEEDKELLKNYQNRLKYIFVDEYQDINKGQYKLIKMMVENSDPRINICVIGDQDQAIYGFRGSDIKYFNSFTKDFEESEIIKLEKNYRSTETILEASFQIIRCQHEEKEKRVYSDIDGHRTINILELPNQRKEALTVGKIIEQMVGGTGFHDLDTGRVKDIPKGDYRAFSDFSVLCRTKRQLTLIEEVLNSKGIPCQTIIREKIFEKKYIGELLSLLKITEGKGCFADLEKTLMLFKSGIGKKSSDKFKNWIYNKNFTLKEAFIKARMFPVPGIRGDIQNKINGLIENIDVLKKKIAGKPVSNKIKIIIENTPIRAAMEKDENLKDIINKMIPFAESFHHETGDFISAIAMQTDIDSYENNAEKITLMTMHASKGLEFPVVFICGCEDELIPYKRPGEDISIDEERRLFYVAMTRAKERLYLSYAKNRLVYGENLPRRISPFLKDIEKNLKYNETPVKGEKEEPAHKQLSLF